MSASGIATDQADLPPTAGVYEATVSRPQRTLADETYELTLRAPRVAAAIRPGQFVMFRDEENSDPLLGRPFALYATSGDEFSVAYHVIGKQTRLMTDWAEGQPVRLWGPLGNGFDGTLTGRSLLFIGGGIGYSPFPAVAKAALGLDGTPRRFELAELLYGARTQSLIADTSDFDGWDGLSVTICTDDGTAGHAGLVTDVLDERLQGPDRPDHVFTCGPVPMMKAVAARCGAAGVACDLSLETPMACGFGACYSCVVPVRDDASPTGWDYRRSCVEGPVFRACELDLSEL